MVTSKSCKTPQPECVDRLAGIETNLEHNTEVLQENAASLKEHMHRTALLEVQQSETITTLKKIAEAQDKIDELIKGVKAYKTVAFVFWKPAVFLFGAAALGAMGAKSDIVLAFLKAVFGG
jgi:hypothetical protein